MSEMDLTAILDETALEEALSRPYPEDVATAKRLNAPVMVLGAGGKMGPSLVERIVRAMAEAAVSQPVYAVSRFSNDAEQQRLEALGAVVQVADLMEESDLAALPDCPNVIYMAGTKFGATGNEDLTWAMNAYVPGRVAARFRKSRIVALSTGNVYPFVSPESGGCIETDPVGPVGEYAQSCLGRERVLQYFSRTQQIPMSIIRLNYAVELRYGVLCDLARRISEGAPIHRGMGWVNCIWQGDANSVIFRSLEHTTTPADILNLTGPEILSVPDLAERLGAMLGRSPRFEGEQGQDALLNNATRCHARFGPPRIPLDNVMEGVAAWIQRGGALLGKPTKFEVRNGKF